jgi:hypothetical protein
MRYFFWSFALLIVGLIFVSWWGHSQGGVTLMIQMVWLTLILIIMEISLSFDNAVVNASILKTWNVFWQKLFLTVGIFIAVFGMRLLFPIVIVAQTADMSWSEVWNLAINNPNDYAAKLTSHHAEISAFGGMFLLLVFLNFIFDHEKDEHWLGTIEEKLGLLGKIDTISVFVAIIILVSTLNLCEIDHKFAVLISGIWGIIVYLGVDIISAFFENQEEHRDLSTTVKNGSIGGFLYLEVLDASFSFDGVIGAFAITKDIIVIMVGLGIGAMFVRSLTMYLVEKDTLSEYIFLEHGAHYAIGALALIMLLSVKIHIPEVITGLIGVSFILLALYSSIRHNKKENV